MSDNSNDKPQKGRSIEKPVYWDGDKYFFKIYEVVPGKYRFGIYFKNSPDIVVGLLPRRFSPHIKREFYRSLEYAGKIIMNIAEDRGWIRIK